MKKVSILILSMLFLTNLLYSENKGEQIFKSAEERCKKINDYRCTFEFTEIKKDGKSYAEYDFSFIKAEGLRRMEVIDGDNKGVILVYRPDKDKNKVKVKKIIPLTLDKNDERIEGFFKTDFISDLYYIKYHLNKGKINYIKEEKVSNRKCHLLEFVAGKKTEWTKAFLWVDEKLLVPVQIEKYDNDKLLSKKVYKKIEIDVGLNREDFKF